LTRRGLVDQIFGWSQEGTPQNVEKSRCPWWTDLRHGWFMCRWSKIHMFFYYSPI